MNAEAFKFALDRGQEMFETGIGRTSYEYGLLNLEEDIAVDEYTLQISLVAPTPYFLGLLTHSSTYPVHRPSVERHGARFGVAGEVDDSHAAATEQPADAVFIDAFHGWQPKRVDQRRRVAWDSGNPAARIFFTTVSTS